MVEQRICQTQVAFRVFEVNRVNLVRHGGRADFASDSALFEVTQADITPDITIEVDQNGVKAGNRIKQFSDIIVRLDLSGVRVPGQTQAGHELLGEGMPVHFRVSTDMRVVVTDGTVDLAQEFHCHDLFVLTFQTVRHVRHFFTQRSRGRRLAVSTGQHRYSAVFLRQIFHRDDQFFAVRRNHFFTRCFQHQAVRVVVDIF